jgi:PAS domain S-box-containing protein
VNYPLNSFVDTPSKLLLLCSDPELELLLRAQLPAVYSTMQRTEWIDATELDLNQKYDAVLFDLRESDSIPSSHQTFVQHDCRLAGIGLFSDFKNMEAQSEILPQLHSYMLLKNLVEGELWFRITQAIKRAHREFETSADQNRLRALLDNIPDIIYFKDLQSRFVEVNKGFCGKFGMGVSEVFGKSDFDIFSEEHASAAFEDEQNIIHKDQSVIRKVEKETFPSGEINWVSTTKIPLKDSQGTLIGTMGISRDISELKEIEIKLKTAILTLEDTQLQLIEAEKLKSVGRMAAGIAHEVKNPLSIVTLGVDFLRKQLAGEDHLLQMLTDMKDAITKANDVIFELLDYSSPHEMNLEPKQINDMIHRVLMLLQHNLKAAHIVCIEELDPNLPEIRIDPQKMEQVLINLLLNCIHAMPAGGPIVIRSRQTRMQSTGANVSSELTEHFRIGDPIVQIEIVDSGHGIAAKDMGKLFDPFYSTNSTGSGTGLGLTVTRKIVEIHRALITLENRKDAAGSCATLYFHPA